MQKKPPAPMPSSDTFAPYSSLFPDLIPVALPAADAAVCTLDGRPAMLARFLESADAMGVKPLLDLVSNARMPLLLLNLPQHLTACLENLCVPLVGLDALPQDTADCYPLDTQLHSHGCTQRQIALLLDDFQKLSGNDLRKARLARRNRQACTMEQVQVRTPKEDEVETIHQFFQPYVLRNEILPRSHEEIRRALPSFKVAVNGQDQIIGVVSLRDFGEGLYEVRSLTVRKDCEGGGIGSRLVKDIVQLAIGQGAKRIFTLTMRTRLFERLGFVPVCIMRFPGKVQNDCLRCSKKEHCDEVALVLEP